MFETGEARHFEFSLQVDRDAWQITPNGVWSGLRDHFKFGKICDNISGNCTR